MSYGGSDVHVRTNHIRSARSTDIREFGPTSEMQVMTREGNLRVIIQAQLYMIAMVPVEMIVE